MIIFIMQYQTVSSKTLETAVKAEESVNKINLIIIIINGILNY